MNKGFIMLDRELQDEYFYLSERFTRSQAFIDLCFQASYKEREFYVRGIKVELMPYELAISENKLAERWQWSRNTVRKFLSELVVSGIIEQKSSKLVNIITIKKYLTIEHQNEQQNTLKNKMLGEQLALFNEHQNEQQIEQQNEQQTGIIFNKDNNLIKEKTDTNVSVIKKEVTKKFVKPTIDEIRMYCIEKGYTFDPEAFFAFYESNGWRVGRNPMKNWKMACTTWSKDKRNNNTNNYGRFKTNSDAFDESVKESNEFSQKLHSRFGD